MAGIFRRWLTLSPLGTSAGTASGSGSAAGAGGATIAIIGAAAGGSVATAQGSIIVAAIGVAAATAAALATGTTLAVHAGTGTASGSSTVAAIGAAFNAAAGTATGTGTASAPIIALGTQARNGVATGSGTASAVGTVVSKGNAAGTSSALAVGVARQPLLAALQARDNVFLITMQAHDGSGVVTHRFATEGVFTQSTISPLTALWFEPRVIDPGNFERHMFSPGTTRGASSIGAGDVVLASADSGRGGDTLDYLLNHAFDGREVIIQTLRTPRTDYSAATTLFTGIVDQIVSDDAYERLSFRIHDRLSDLDTPLLVDTWPGTTITGGDGTANGNEDIKGQKKQRCYGTVFNVTPQVANPFDLVYAFSDGPLVSVAVYDGGLALTYSGDFANLAALLAWTQVPGNYVTCLVLGLVRTGTAPIFSLTADVVEGVTAAARTAGQITTYIITDWFNDSGLSGSVPIDATCFSDLDAKNSAVCGVLVTADETVLETITRVLDSIGGYLLPDNIGIFACGRLEAPQTSPTPTVAGMFDESNIIGSSLERVTTGDEGRGIPNYRVTVRYAHNSTIMDGSQVAGAVTQAYKTFLSQEWRSTAPAEDLAVKARYLKSSELIIDTALAFESDAIVESARLLGLYGTQRECYRIQTPLHYGRTVNVGDIVTLASPRFGLSAGKYFVTIGRTDNYEEKIIQLELWG